MKKYLFFLSVLGIVLFTACTKDDLAKEMSPEERVAAIIAEANMDSEIPINLGFGSQSNYSSVTRAPLESDDNKLFSTPSGSYLGVFCLAQKPQVATSNPGPVAENLIDWTANQDNLTWLMKKNLPARVVKVKAGSKIGTATATSTTSDVQYMEVNGSGDPTGNIKHYYYPYGNWYNYYFYAYYPWDKNIVTTQARQVTAAFELDGSQDVIWGKAMPITTTSGEDPESDVDRGFNAKYIRDKQKDGNGHRTGINSMNDLPKLTLEHKLAMLRFYVKTTDVSYSTVIANPEDFQLTALSFKDVPKNWTLTIANNVIPDGQSTSPHTGEGEMTITNNTTGTVNIYSMSSTYSAAEANEYNADLPDGIKSGTALTAAQATAVNTTLGTSYSEGDAITEANANSYNATLTGHKTAGDAKAQPTGTDTGAFAGGNLDIPFSNDGSALLVGYAMIPTTDMIKRANDAGSSFPENPYISFTLNVNGETWNSSAQMINKPTLNNVPNAGEFEAGLVYNIILDIPVPVEGVAWATLEAWQAKLITENSDQNIEMTIQ